MNGNKPEESVDSFMNNDFDIVEHFSDDDVDSSADDLPQPIYDSSGFPKAKHRNESEYPLSKPQEYDELILKPLEEMSIEEIKEAQNYLYQKLGKEMCDFIKERKLKRMAENQTQTVPDTSQKLEKTQPDSPNDLIFKFDKREFLKYQWMSPAESAQNKQTNLSNTSAEKLSLHELRFNFEGFPIFSSEDANAYDSTLYSHGLDSDKPGYTLPELLHLLQSSFKPQVQISIKAISNILFNSYSPHRSGTDDGLDAHSRLGQTCFSYLPYRWNKYIGSDLDLVNKLGYAICENQLTTIILIDSLRCLSLLTSGDSSRWNNFDSVEDQVVVPVQCVLFDYYQFYSGLDIYFWNSLHLDLLETNLYTPSDPFPSDSKLKGFEGLSLNLSLKFYSKLLNGGYQSSTNQDILKDLFTNIELDDSEDLELESKLYLLCKHNIVYKLLLIMRRYRDNSKVQIYCTSVISGFLMSFGTPLANALIEFSLFREHFEFILNVLATQANRHYVHLNGAVLYLVMLLSVYLDHIPDYFGCFISLIKETVTRTFSSQLKSLNMIDHCSDDHDLFKGYASTAIKCLTVWATKGYLLDALDEFVPLFSLNCFKLSQHLSTGATNANELDCDHYHVLSALNFQFSTCLRLNNMHSHFKMNGVIDKVNEMVECFANSSSLERHTCYYLYSLLQLQYDYIDAMVSSGSHDKLEVSSGSLWKLIGTVLNSFTFEFPESLIHLTWFDDSLFTGSRACLYRRDLIREEFNEFLLPYNILNLILNSLLKLKLASNEDGMAAGECVNVFKNYKKRLFDLADELVNHLKEVYLKLHKSSLFYLNSTVHLVKSVPVFEPVLVYLRTLVDFGYDCSMCIIATMALSVDYNRLEDVLGLLCRQNPTLSSATYSMVDVVLNQFRDFNKYVSSYSLGSDTLPMVSFLTYLTYLPLNFNEHYEVDLHGLLLNKYGTSVLDWVKPRFLFAQLVLTINSCPDDLMANLPIEKYELFQSLLFDRLSTPFSLELNSTDLVDQWVECLNKFNSFLKNGKELDKNCHENKVLNYFDSEEAMKSSCSKLVGKFNAGQCDSPVTVGLIMLFASHWSNEECAKVIWSDESLMLLVGRNLRLDFENYEVKSTLVESFTIGSIYTFSFFPESIVKSQMSMVSLFSDESVKRRDPVLFLILASLLNHSVDLKSLNTQSALIDQIIGNLSS